jgi:hypothetical protein
MTPNPANTHRPLFEPVVPRQIKIAALRGKLVLFVGAGASRLAGSPSWAEFADKLLAQLCTKKLISYAELQQLRDYYPKTRLSIAKDICRDSGVTIDYKGILQPHGPSRADLILFEHLVSIGAPFVTTNYDLLIEIAAVTSPGATVVTKEEGPPQSGLGTARELKSIHLVSDLRTDLLYQPDHVFHLHGSVDDYDGMIISTRDYLEHYANPDVIEFLRVLFTEFTVLFIGYGVDELEILEYVFLKKPSKRKQNVEGQHHWLFPTFSYEAQLLDRLTKYYRYHRNVELHGYCRDESNFRQLISVIETWAKEINYRPPGFSETVKVIERAFP